MKPNHRCGCTRCILQIDLARGFRCLKCRSGAHYYVENSPAQQLTACDVCAELCRDSEREQCLQLEPEYVQRIESLDRSNVQDVELVYNAALDFFHDNHWCVFACDQMLWEYYREKDSEVAMLHLKGRKNRIKISLDTTMRMPVGVGVRRVARLVAMVSFSYDLPEV